MWSHWAHDCHPCRDGIGQGHRTVRKPPPPHVPAFFEVRRLSNSEKSSLIVPFRLLKRSKDPGGESGGDCRGPPLPAFHCPPGPGWAGISAPCGENQRASSVQPHNSSRRAGSQAGGKPRHSDTEPGVSHHPSVPQAWLCVGIYGELHPVSRRSQASFRWGPSIRVFKTPPATLMCVPHRALVPGEWALLGGKLL